MQITESVIPHIIQSQTVLVISQTESIISQGYSFRSLYTFSYRPIDRSVSAASRAAPLAELPRRSNAFLVARVSPGYGLWIIIIFLHFP